MKIDFRHRRRFFVGFIFPMAFAFFIFPIIFENPAQALPTEFRGHYAVQMGLHERVFQTPNRFNLMTYLGSGELLNLLGTYNVGPAGHSRFQNGIPNSTNMLLWHIAMSGLAKEISRICTNTSGLDFKPEFLVTLRSVCLWPAPEAKSEALLLDFWFYLMGYEALESEYEAWRDFFLLGPYAQGDGSETVSAMALSIFMNPYFLLK